METHGRIAMPAVPIDSLAILFAVDAANRLLRMLGMSCNGGLKNTMTIDWLFIGYLLGFVTAAWVCPAIGKMIKQWNEEQFK